MQSDSIISVAQEIAARHGIDPSQFWDRDRRRKVSWARQELCYALSNAGVSIWEIARQLNLDRVTVRYGIAQTQARMKEANG